MGYGWLYLHFLDRELLTTCGLYGNMSARRIQDDFIMSLLSITEPAYISTSVLFESDYAFDVFFQYREIFSRQDIIRVAGIFEQLGEFVLRKRHDYSEVRSRYPRYFTESWREIEDAAPVLAVKRQDTTQFLKTRVDQRLVALLASSGDFLDGGQIVGFKSLIERLRCILQRCGGSPVTPALFEPVLREADAHDSWRVQSNLQISLAYIESYMAECGGAIPTGLKCGLRMVEALSQTFPIHCLNVWREIYNVLGIYPVILDMPADCIVRIREMDVHAFFVGVVRSLLEQSGDEGSASAVKKPDGTSYDAWCISRVIAGWLPKCRFDGSMPYVGFVEKTLHSAVRALNERQRVATRKNPRQQLPRERSDNLAFYFDAARGVLKGTDGRMIALDERVARVLLALAGDIRGASGVGPLGRISDVGVASLYSGTRREWEAVEAAKVAYQFTRVLRRSLSRAGVHDRDAIVRRLRGSGIAMGTRWARPAVRGKSEVGLLLGRHRDAAERAYDDWDDDHEA
ncbi:hypothetical protein WME90_44535 [Sorangium sp. So ce375]|uniref:hypothetical protein n=1 Tax=Sorangium sp. So ce375 TaxID=3133306 RepID=UPI003F5BF20D